MALRMMGKLRIEPKNDAMKWTKGNIIHQASLVP